MENGFDRSGLENSVIGRFFIPLMLFSWYACAQFYNFRHYTVDDGLSQSVVNCFFQDSQGYIWIGTQDGLNQFDGFTFRKFIHNPYDSTTISNNWVYAVTEGPAGDIWVGTRQGLNRYRKATGAFDCFTHNPADPHSIAGNNVYGVTVDAAGRIIANTPPAISVLDPRSGRFTRHVSALEPSTAVEDQQVPILVDRAGLIWAASTTGLACLDPETGRFAHYRAGEQLLSDDYVTSLFEDADGDIWVGTRRGLDRFHRKVGQRFTYRSKPGDPGGLPTDFIRAVARDRTGRLWVGTDGGGLTRMEVGPVPALHTGIHFRHSTTQSNCISHDIVSALLLDRSNNLWIGTLNGVDRIDLKKRKFQLIRKADDPGSVDLLDNVIASIYKDPSGIVWIGNWGKGLNRYDRRTGEVRHYSASLPNERRIANDYVHVIFEDRQGRVWLGTRDGVNIFLDDRRGFATIRQYFRTDRLPGFRANRVFCMLQDDEGNIWLGTRDGLYRLDLEAPAFTVYQAGAGGTHSPSANLIYALLQDKDRSIWVGTSDGLDRFDPRTGTFAHYRQGPTGSNSLCDNFIVSLCEDSTGRIWIGTKNGVNTLDKGTGRFTYYSTSEGLPSNIVYEILEDDARNVWLSTGRGLTRFLRSTGRFQTFTVEDGLQGLEFNLKASYKSRDGELFFGGMNGLNSFYPNELKENDAIPPVVITSFDKEGERGRRTINVYGRDEVVLEPEDYAFTIEFAALEFTNPERNQYAYRMEGVADTWIDIGNRRFVPFSNLPPGTYVFRVKGSNNDKVWNETGASLRVVVKPPWWKSRAAVFSYMLAFGCGVFLFIKVRERSFRTRHAIEEELRLAGEIQKRLLPDQAPEFPDYDIVGVSIPARSVGGDYFDFIPLPGDREGICIADVSGKGLPASLLMANVQAVMRSQALFEAPLEVFLQRANILLCRSTGAERFVTLFYGVLDPDTHSFEYVNAGHNPPFLVQQDGRIRRLDQGGVILGVFSDAVYEKEILTLDPGDAVVMFSDGITDLSDTVDESAEEARLEDVIRRNFGASAQELIHAILRGVRSRTSVSAARDDMTLVVVRRLLR